MIEVKEEFARRTHELISYVRFTESICNGDVLFSSNGGQIDTQISKTMKASCYLLIYNLIESTARKTVQAVFDHIEDEGVRFDDVIDELKVFVLKHTLKQSPEKLVAGITNIAKDIFTESIDSKEFFSGNVDARKLRETAEKLGVSKTVKRNGNKLLTIKTNRNDLAHGHKSFHEIGSDTSVLDLLQHVSETFWYMKGVLGNFCNYIDGKKYLKTA